MWMENEPQRRKKNHCQDRMEDGGNKSEMKMGITKERRNKLNLMKNYRPNNKDASHQHPYRKNTGESFVGAFIIC